MTISINNQPVDITLDTEKTLGDVLSGLEQWVSQGGNRIRKVSVNGKDVPEDALTAAFNIKVEDIENLDIVVSSYRELAAEALNYLHETCTLYGNAAFEERVNINAQWEKSAAACFLASDIPDVYDLATRSFSGEGLLVSNLAILVEERFREITDPCGEVNNSEALVKDITQRMEEFSLDIQTGKDKRAAETMQLFSQMGEKLFRIFFIHKSDGLSLDTFIIDKLPVHTFMGEFNTALKELSLAYENRDTVLAGDMAEYELAPRLLKFFEALKSITVSNFPVISV